MKKIFLILLISTGLLSITHGQGDVIDKATLELQANFKKKLLSDSLGIDAVTFSKMSQLKDGLFKNTSALARQGSLDSSELEFQQKALRRYYTSQLTKLLGEATYQRYRTLVVAMTYQRGRFEKPLAED